MLSGPLVITCAAACGLFGVFALLWRNLGTAGRRVCDVGPRDRWDKLLITIQPDPFHAGYRMLHQAVSRLIP